MPSNICMGCRSYFEEGEKVQLESMFVEFKNYFLPLRESKQRWILLKTLTGFLNSKGGTIYIGVEDKQGQVLGLPLTHKEQDDFNLFMKDFVEKIRPAVDLNKEEIKIVYVPVVTNKVFRGKYIIKIIVKQGDPAKTYRFAQRIELESSSRVEEFQVYHAFYRHNMGGIVEIRGEALLEEIARKAANPSEVSSTFHKFCNPSPLKLDGPLTKIGFSGIRREQLRKRLQQIFHSNLQTLQIEYELTYDIENQVLLIELESPEKFKTINKYMKENLNKLNESGFNFVEKGENLDFYLYKNIAGVREISPRDRSRESSPVSPSVLSFKKSVEKVEKVEISEREKGVKSSDEVWEYVAGQESPQKEGKSSSVKPNKDLQEKALSKQFILTVTHINSDKLAALQVFLRNLIGEKYAVKFDKYVHTLQIRFDSRQNVLNFNQLLQKQSGKLSQFGVQGNLVVGINLKAIRISNYDRNKRKELKTFIRSKLKEDAEEVEFKKSNNKFFLECKFKTRELTCNWLDQLLTDASIKQFVIPGSEQGKAGKLRIYIDCLVN